jgi:hypothetical protein
MVAALAILAAGPACSKDDAAEVAPSPASLPQDPPDLKAKGLPDPALDPAPASASAPTPVPVPTPVLAPTPALASASASAPAKPSARAAPTCGDKPLPPCPLYAWMKANTSTAMSAEDFDALAAALDKAATFAPAGYANWASIAQDGASAAHAQSLDGVKASCRGCHNQYKDKYKKEMRDRPI